MPTDSVWHSLINIGMSVTVGFALACKFRRHRCVPAATVFVHYFYLSKVAVCLDY